MEFKEVVAKRRTVRQFKDNPVEREKIERILEAGVMATSFDHARKWNFIVISEPEAKARAIECIKELPCAFEEPKNPIQEMIRIAFPKQKTMFEEAPYLILPLLKRDPRIVGENLPRSTMDIAEIWCVIENIFLAAVDEGLACTMRIPKGDQPEQIMAAVGGPEGYTVPCMIGVGYAADNAEIPTQVFPKIADCVHWERW